MKPSNAITLDQQDNQIQLFNKIWICLLFIAGLFLWVKFLNFGDIHFTYLDWGEDSGPRLVFLQSALQDGLLPYHMPNASGLVNVSDRYLSIPDVLFSPHALLLKLLTPETFVIVHVLLLYSLGFCGLAILRRRYTLTWLPFTVLFLLFNFNGHILSHLSAGHLPWAGYFLFPWFILQVMRLLEERQDWRWVFQTAVLLFFLFLQGSFHQFSISLIFLGLIALTAIKKHWPALAAVGASLALSLVRIMPTLLVVNNFNTVFHGGFPTFYAVIEGLASIHTPDSGLSVPGGKTMGWWEFDLYIGISGLLFLLIFGFLRWLSSKEENDRYMNLLFPFIVMTVSSMGTVFKVFTQLSIPTGIRVTTRFIVLPLLFLCLLAVMQFNTWLAKHNKNRALWLVLLSGLGVLLSELWQHFKVWQLSNMLQVFGEGRFVPSIWTVANYPDPSYMRYLLYGVLGSSATLLVLIGLSLYSARKARRTALEDS